MKPNRDPSPQDSLDPTLTCTACYTPLLGFVELLTPSSSPAEIPGRCTELQCEALSSNPSLTEKSKDKMYSQIMQSSIIKCQLFTFIVNTVEGVPGRGGQAFLGLGDSD
jgi:hypothetical protein